MKKEVISMVCTAALALSAVPAMAEEPAAEANEKVLFGNEVFHEQSVRLYNDADTAGYISQIWDNYGVEAIMGNEWSTDNGIKTDVTKYVAGLSGASFEASIDVSSWAWTYETEDGGVGVNAAKLFFEVVDENGAKAVTSIAEGPGVAEDIIDNTASLSGTAILSFEDTDKVYLCATQGGGTEQFKNMSLSVLRDEQLFGNEIFEEGNFTIYDDTDNAGSISDVWSDYGIQAVMGNSWDDNNGIKTDVSEYVKEYSGRSFGVSAEVTSWAWIYENEDGSLGVNKAKAFFKVVGDEGEKIVPITEGPDSAEAITDNAAVVSGSAELSFNENDTVYLCFTQGGGQQQYKNISFTVQSPDKLVGNEIFGKGFEIYDDEDTEGKITQVWDNYGIEATMGKSWADNNGVKLNVTRYVSGRSGARFSVSVDVTSYAWNGKAEDGTDIINKASVFFKAVDPEGKETITALCEGPENSADITEDTATLSGSAVLSFGGEDTVYLCITQGGGVQQYKNISLSAEEQENVIVETPALNDKGDKVTVTASNPADSDAELMVYVAEYNNGVLSGVKVNKALVAAGAVSESFEFDAASGNTVYVWNNGQEPYIPKTVL